MLDPDESESLLRRKAAGRLGLAESDLHSLQIVRRSVDARGRHPRFNYAVTVCLATAEAERECVAGGAALPAEEPPPPEPARGTEEARGRVVVAGCGPAGLFAALYLARAGYRPLLIERGAPVDRRHADVLAFLSRRELDPESNFLFGAGGAGTYSDGKLYTRVHDPRVRYVIDTFVAGGAPEALRVDARPHVGTDRLHGIVAWMCAEIERLGGVIRWGTRLTGLESEAGRLTAARAGGERIETNCLVLATGANAADTFAALRGSGVAMEAKPFQMGLRIEHPRELIDRAVYGAFAGHARLGAADYVLSDGTVTSFCVCPGGTLVPAVSEAGCVCTNGMSGSARDGEFTNGALVATVAPGAEGADPLGGLEFQRRWERAAFRLAGGDYTAPAQGAPEFLSGRTGGLRRGTSYPLGVRAARLDDALPDAVASAIRAALPRFERRLRGFAGAGAVLVGPEARASCPVRLLRDPERRVSLGMDGLYPVGEGAGYAGGITSSAVDGLRSAEAVAARFAAPRC
jgi:uncharacterized FAD-dependent dehydrogenase